MKIEVSNGEIIDKITILFIKINKIKDEKKLLNIKKEYDDLLNIMEKIGITMKDKIFQDLLCVNLELWMIEDSIRVKEKKKEFDDDFIKLARSVYRINDKRFELKNKINKTTKSNFIEEKSYEEY